MNDWVNKITDYSLNTCHPINGNSSTKGSSDKSDYFNDYSIEWKNDEDLGDAIVNVLNTQGKKVEDEDMAIREGDDVAEFEKDAFKSK
ncbi:hypothetical protein Ancab_032854, partial [Ancistrocladus abbreviatus]